tara:strand:- start:29797 stop:30138 length:342 start_codon:yes stop_codon:yes gene_type:complete
MCERLGTVTTLKHIGLSEEGWPEYERQPNAICQHAAALLTRQQKDMERLKLEKAHILASRSVAWEATDRAEAALKNVRGCLMVIASNDWASAQYARNFAEQALDTLAALQAKP